MFLSIIGFEIVFSDALLHCPSGKSNSSRSGMLRENDVKVIKAPNDLNDLKDFKDLIVSC